MKSPWDEKLEAQPYVLVTRAYQTRVSFKMLHGMQKRKETMQVLFSL